MSILPTQDQLNELSNHRSHGPVVMLNLLRFKPAGGQASYDRYSEGVQPLLERAGAEVVWYGGADSVVIGDQPTERWDSVILVRYPSRSAFLEMVSSPEYQEIGELRTEALEDSRLIACTEVFPAPGS